MHHARRWIGLTVGALIAAGVWVWVWGGGADRSATPRPVLVAAPAPQPLATAIERAPAPERRGPDLSEPISDRAASTPVNNPAPPPEGKDTGEKPEWDEAALLKKFDADGDDRLSKQEWAVAKQASSPKQPNPRLQALMRVLNDRYDTDRDGELSADERRVLNGEFGAAKRQIVSDLMPLYDLDGDGRLTGEERKTAGPEFQAAFERLGMFALLDDDGSWDIDAVELAAAISAMAEGDDLMDLNGDGRFDHEDAALAADIAAGGG